MRGSSYGWRYGLSHPSPAHPTPANIRDSGRTDGRTGGRAGDDDMAIGGKVRWYDGRYSILFINTAGLV